ncbi:hypothetical protein [Streptomyces sp. NPDC046939]|uniref:hypothetical protein n=1 Tax=Streptomyces sp. NPDC046939 TaxID=3155376 RepID=UPI0033FF6DB3
MPIQPPRPSYELVAAALRTYGALLANRTQPVPFTAPGPGASGALGLAVFVTVYAAHSGTPCTAAP